MHIIIIIIIVIIIKCNLKMQRPEMSCLKKHVPGWIINIIYQEGYSQVMNILAISKSFWEVIKDVLRWDLNDLTSNYVVIIT